MRITHLAVREFRRHRALDLELAPGLTIIRGPNEAGKSTIQRAIELALTRKVTSTGADLEALVPWAAPPGTRPAVGLAFTYEDADGATRSGRLEKTFRGPRGTVVLELDEERVTDPSRADELLAALSGIPGEAFLRATAAVRHLELAELAGDERTLRDRLQASIGGSDRGTGAVQRQLEQALARLRAQGAKNPGQIVTAERILDESERRLAAGEEALGRLAADRDALVEARERRAAAAARLMEERAILEKAGRGERLAAERRAAEERFARLRDAAAAADELAGVEARLAADPDAAELRDGVAELRALDAALAVRPATPPMDTRHGAAGPGPGRAGLVVAALLAAAGAAAIAAAVGGLAAGGAPLLPVGVVLAAAGLLVAGGALLRARRTGPGPAPAAAPAAWAAGGMHHPGEPWDGPAAAATRRRELLDRLGVAGLAEAEALLRDREAAATVAAGLRGRIAGLAGELPAVELAAERDAAALEADLHRSALEALGPVAHDPRARERLERSVAEAETEAAAAADDEARAAARVDLNRVDAEEIATLAERVAAWREELAAVRRRERVYAAALAAIAAAAQGTMERATRHLERHMDGDVARITGGRYDRVRVADDLAIELLAPERGDWVAVEDLSRGTIDAVHLAARLGLIRLVTGDRRPPLLLDDPFVTLDDARATRALDLVRTLAADHQVVYFTTSGRYDPVADRVVELAGPPAPVGPAGGAAGG